MGPFEIQLEKLRDRIGPVIVQEIPGLGQLLRVINVQLPSGWSKQVIEVSFVVPQGYPFAKPDCFWADLDLRLANGNLPQNTRLDNPIPGVPDPLIWFSWHVDPWNPNQDDLCTWFAIIKRRLAQVI